MTAAINKRPRYHFVTGRLAERALREIVKESSVKLGFDYTVDVMPITVAALITPRWLARHLVVPVGTTEVILPGFVGDKIDDLQSTFKVPFRVGPKDLRDLPEFFGGEKKKSFDPVTHQFAHRVEIIAEINHAPRMTIEELLATAECLRNDGADRIDVGCQPGERWRQVGTALDELVTAGHSVSIDSFDYDEVAIACKHGATLVLSVNSQNADRAVDWGVEVVAIPDTPDDLPSLDRTIAILEKNNVAYRLDPILEPIGMGLANSLVRYHTIRHRYPDASMMMGIGNLTELTDVDSAGVNMLLIGICVELQINSVLTTQVINWARSSVRECDFARRSIDHAVQHGIPPKRVDDSLVVLREPKLKTYPSDWFASLSESIRDNNYRLYAQDDLLHLVSAGLYCRDDDPFRLFDQLLADARSKNVDVSHAFYLGYELAKAKLALQLGKQYQQDQALNWGHLTIPENLHRLKRGRQ